MSELERPGAPGEDRAERRHGHWPERLLLGIDAKADQKAAYRMVQQAAQLGHADGRRAWVYLTAAGIGRKADPKAARHMLAELAKEDKFAALQAGLPRPCQLREEAGRGRAESRFRGPLYRALPAALQRGGVPLSGGARHAVAGESRRARPVRRGTDGRTDPRRPVLQHPEPGRGSGRAGDQPLHRHGDRYASRAGASRSTSSNMRPASNTARTMTALGRTMSRSAS